MKNKELEIANAAALLNLLGFTLLPEEVPLVQSAEGGLILCMDDRNKLHKKLPGAAIPGGFTGLRIIMPGETADVRAKEALHRSKEASLVPTTHGDLLKDAILGCAVRSALVDGFLHGFPRTTIAESTRMIREYGIHHRILRGEHTAGKILLNFNEGTTVDPKGQYFVVDYWLPVILGARMDKFISLLVQSAELVLPRTSKLYLAN